MKIRLMSDIHNEFGRLIVPVLENEKDIVLVLAGDIGVASHASQTISPFLHDVLARHRAVIYVCGNHEHYKGSIDRSVDKIKSTMMMNTKGYVTKTVPANLHVLENETVVIDDVAFVGATFWTNFHKNHPIAMWDAQQTMNDYRMIRTGPRGDYYKYKLKPGDVLNRHTQSATHLFGFGNELGEIAKQKVAGNKVFVVTHHAPSYESIAPWFRTSIDYMINGSYASEYDYQIMDAQPNIWAHGHTHTNFDYMIEGTRVLCNPRGYAEEELNPGFNPNLLIDL